MLFLARVHWQRIKYVRRQIAAQKQRTYLSLEAWLLSLKQGFDPSRLTFTEPTKATVKRSLALDSKYVCKAFDTSAPARRHLIGGKCSVSQGHSCVLEGFVALI